MRIDQLAINTVSLRGDFLEVLDACALAGFEQVEFPLGSVKAFMAQHGGVADVRRELSERRLRCIGGFECAAVCFGDDKARNANHQLLVDNARLIHALGGACMVVGTDGPAEPVDDPLDPIARTLAGIGQAIADTGVTLCVEFNWSPVVKSMRTAAEVARRAACPQVAVVFDPAHYHCTPSKLEHLTAENVATVRHVHLNDMRDRPGELSNCNADRVLPGRGCLDLPTLIGALEQHGYQGAFSIELFNEELWSIPPREAAQRMYDSLVPLCG